MKKSTLLFLVCWLWRLAPLHAQTPPPDSLRQHLNYLFARVDKTQVPTPYLEEYGLRFLPLDVFNGVLTDSSRTTIQAFRMAYASIVTGHITGSSVLPALSDFNTRLSTQVAASAAIPIAMQRISYAALRPDALTSGLFTAQGEQLYDVAGRSQSPYLQRVLFMAAPARVTAPTGDVSFVFAQDLHLQSGGGGLRSLSLDFGDGRGYLPATWGQPLGANYCTAGIKRIRVRASYNLSFASSAAQTSGPTKQVAGPPPPAVTYESWFDPEVAEPGCAPQARYADPGRVVPFGPTAQHSGGQVHIRYGSTGRTQLLRPLIVAEGYDVSRIAPDLQSNYDVGDFLRSINPDFGYNLFDDLENAPGTAGVTGYDIVFIDYANGTDDIQRNAALFRDVVAWVNDEKARNGSTEPNVVLGISMGGLVARYGLAQMERAQPNSSQTRLLVTHDSPHRGANTPLGLQALTRQANATLAVQLVGGINALFGTDIFPEVFQAEALLDAPATQQLLLVQATRLGAGIYSVFGSRYNTFINNVYQPMVSGTFPYQFVATSLGSQCAVPSLQPYSELLRYNFSGFVSPMPWIKRTSYRAEIVVNAMPSPGLVERISVLRLYRQVRTLLVFNHRSYFTNFSFHSPANNPVAWDGLPGGTQNVTTQARINPPTPSISLLWFVNIQGNFSTAGDFCFIPTASALDVPLDNTTTRASYVSNLTTGPSQPVAARFIAQERINTTQGLLFNFPHPLFPGRQAEWIFNEMQNQSNPLRFCTTECSPYPAVSITGTDIICANSSATFTVAPPFGGVTDWTVSPAGLATFTTPTAGATSVTLVPASSSSNGLVTLTAQISNGCYNTTATRRVAVGEGRVVVTNAQGNQNGTTCAVSRATFTITESYGSVGPYTWYVYNSGPNFNYSVSSDTKSITFTNLPYSNYSLNGYVVGATTCAGVSQVQSSFGQQYTTYSGGRSCPSFRMAAPNSPTTATLYPNPAKETVDVHVENADATRPVTVRLFDSYGQARAEQISRGAETVRLVTNKLPAGLYFVHILRGKEVLSRQQLRIEK